MIRLLKLPAMLDKYFTFLQLTLPLRGENYQRLFPQRAKFVEKPTDVITTELSGCFESISRYDRALLVL